MNYQVSRDGQLYGPYTFADLQRYVASGNVLPTDMAKSEAMTDWLPVSQILAGSQAATPASGFSTPVYDPAQASFTPAAQPINGGLAASQYPDAPNLHWGLVLLFSLLTCSLFMWVWNIIVAAWLKRVQPNANSLYLYIGAVVLQFVQLSLVLPTIQLAMAHGHPTSHPGSSLIGLLVWVVRLIARFSQRASLQEHFNTVEPIGLDLNPVLTFFFGGLYFQSELNRINAMKQAARPGAGRGY